MNYLTIKIRFYSFFGDKKITKMKTLIVLLDNRKILEKIENQIFDNTHEMIDQLKEYGMTEDEESTLGYYEISNFMDLVNDQILDNLQDTFLGYVKLNK